MDLYDFRINELFTEFHRIKYLPENNNQNILFSERLLVKSLPLNNGNTNNYLKDYLKRKLQSEIIALSNNPELVIKNNNNRNSNTKEIIHNEYTKQNEMIASEISDILLARLMSDVISSISSILLN